MKIKLIDWIIIHMPPGRIANMPFNNYIAGHLRVFIEADIKRKMKKYLVPKNKNETD